MAGDDKSRCAAPSDGSTVYHFVSDKPALTWDAGGGNIGCAPLTCCSTSSTPPSGFVDGATAGACTADEALEKALCGLKPLCEVGIYLTLAAAGWGLISFLLLAIFAHSALRASKIVSSVSEGANTTVATATAVPMATAVPLDKTPEI